MSQEYMSQRYMTPQELEMMRMRARDDGMGYEPIPDSYPELQSQSVMPDTDSVYAPPPQMQSTASPAISQVPPPKSKSQELMDKQRALVEEFNTPATVQMKRLEDLLNSYPEHEQPSLFRKIVASGLAVGDKGSMKESQDFLNAPFNERLADWKTKATPFHDAAALENTQNTANRNMATSMLSAQTAAARLEEQSRQADLKNEQVIERNHIARLKTEMGPGWIMDAHNGTTVKLFNKTTGEFRDTGISTRWMDEADKLDVEGEFAQRRVETQGQTQRDVTASRNASAEDIAGANIQSREKIAGENNPVVMTDDPDNPGHQIAIEKVNGQWRRVTLGGRQVGSVVKPGTPSQASGITNSTKTMMEGAQMLLPHIPDLRKQATELDKRGLFGPIMSRVRDYAAKIGTTGSPEEVEKSFNDFAVNIMNDPLLTQSNDAAVGQFAMGLGLAASGAGRVHGGARGGGSIQMVNYMKALLSADSSLSMFNGRMNELEKWMKGYAIGPGGSVVTEEKKVPDAIDIAIEKALKGGK